MNLMAIRSHEIHDLWPSISPGIEKMVAKGIGLTTAHDCLCKALSGEWLVFIVLHESKVVLTALTAIERGHRKVFTVVGAWGEQMDEWVDEFHQGMVKIAQEQGCDSISITGRRGWVKFLKPYGFNEKMVTVVKELK